MNTEFTIVVKDWSITCELGRVKGARKFYTGAGVDFYITGKPAKVMDRCCNLVVNKCIEMNIPHRSVHKWE